MSATMSEASHSASGATERRQMVQLPSPAGGHADDVEFDVAAQRVPVERPGDPVPDLVDGGRGFRKQRLGIRSRIPSNGGLADRPAAISGDRLSTGFLGMGWLMIR